MSAPVLAAGRELDALISERVMGLRPARYGFHRVIPLYSTDIAAAWQVVAHLAPADRDGFPSGRHAFSLSMTGQSGWFALFERIIRPRYGDRGRFGEQADTAPLAICRAALAAVEAQDGAA